jgi:predicted RNA-binding protein YlxR (DUF448 family)
MGRGTSSRENGDTVVRRHVPERRCLGCGRRAPKPALVRFVAVHSDDGGRELVRDDAARMPGRGLYVCADRGCFARAVDRGAFRRGARLTGEPLRVDAALADAISAEESVRG